MNRLSLEFREWSWEEKKRKEEIALFSNILSINVTVFNTEMLLRFNFMYQQEITSLRQSHPKPTKFQSPYTKTSSSLVKQIVGKHLVCASKVKKTQANKQPMIIIKFKGWKTKINQIKLLYLSHVPRFSMKTTGKLL